MSQNTTAIGHGGKVEHFRRLDSLTHYLLVEQTRAHAELFHKNALGERLLQALSVSDTLHIAQPHAFDWPVTTLFDEVPLEPASVGR